MLTDSHVHLDTPAFAGDRAEVIARARAQGVELFLEIAGSDVAQGSLDVGIALAEQHDFIYAAIGLHPHEASLYDDALEQKLLQLAAHEKGPRPREETEHRRHEVRYPSREEDCGIRPACGNGGVDTNVIDRHQDAGESTDHIERA